MSSSKDKQTNPRETSSLQATVDTINEWINSLSSAETTTPAANENSSSEQSTSTGNNSADKSDREDGSKKGKDDSGSDTQQLEMLRKNLNQIQDSLIQLQKFEESDLAKELRAHLRSLKAKYETVKDKKERTPSPNAPLSSPKVSSSVQDINKDLMKIKYQIPSFRKLSLTSSKAHSRASSGSNEGSSVLELPMLHESESFPTSSFYSEIKGLFDCLGEEERFILSCFAVLTEGAVVKRRLLTYWGLGMDYLSDSKTKEETPEEIVDNILEKLQEKGFIEPAMRKRKQKVRSYKMDPLVRSAMIMIFEKKKSDGNSNRNAVGHGTTSTFFVKGKEKFVDDGSPSKEVEVEDLNENVYLERLVTLFNVNEHSPDAKLIHLAKKKTKDRNVVDWLSNMKSLQVLYLGRWQKSASYHIEVKDTAFLKGLKSMGELKFLSIQGISRIKELPRSIGMLKNLVVLDLKDCYNLELLPEEISSLTKLRYLDISNCYLLGNMPKKLSSLSELQVLKGFITGDPQRKSLGTLEDLKELKKLKKLTIIATRNDFPTQTDLGALQELEALQNLTIAWGVQKIYLEDETSVRGKAAGSSVHPSDKLPNKLEKLDLQCFPYSTPTWLTPDDLPNLKKLYIRGGNFTTLKKGKWKVEALRLKYLREMKTNWRELKELFPKLVYLERVKCPGITLCPCDENGVWQKSENIKCSGDQYQ